MARVLYENHAYAKGLLDTCHKQLLKHDINLIDTLLTTQNSEIIHQTRYTQPCLFALEYTLARTWLNWGVQPDYLIGHSIGEISAAALSGAIELEDAIDLVATRARLMQNLPNESSMTAVFAPKEAILSLIHDNQLDIAGINH